MDQITCFAVGAVLFFATMLYYAIKSAIAGKDFDWFEAGGITIVIIIIMYTTWKVTN